MLQSNYISSLLNLKGVSIINFNSHSFTIALPRRFHICPCCGRKTNKIHDYRLQKIKHFFKSEAELSIFIRKCRYVCPHCSKRFLEHIPFLGKYQRMTSSMIKFIISQLHSLKSASSIARENNISVSTVLRLLDKISVHSPSLSHVISIDEFKGNANNEKFQFILNDPINKKIIDVLPTRKADYLRSYFLKFSFKERSNVKYVVMDMNKAFRSVIRDCFPNAKIVADKFHVSRCVQWALERVRKEVQKSFFKDRRVYFKKSKYLLLKRYEKLKTEEKWALENMLNKSEKLREAYELKEAFFELTKQEDKKEGLKKWINVVVKYNLKEFNNVSETMYRWFHPILEGLKTRYTNGFTEGMNNKIKVLKRICFGVKRFDRFKKRIIYAAIKRFYNKCWGKRKFSYFNILFFYRKKKHNFILFNKIYRLFV